MSAESWLRRFRADHPGQLPGLILAVLGAVFFAGKAIIVKLAYRHGVDAVTLLMLRMLFALPFFLVIAWWTARPRRGVPAVPVRLRDALGILGLGTTGYYLASYLDFAGLAYISASLERLILYLNPTLVLVFGLLLVATSAATRRLAWPSATAACCWCSAMRPA